MTSHVASEILQQTPNQMCNETRFRSKDFKSFYE